MLKGKLKELREDGTAVIIAQLPVDLVVRRQVREVYIDMIDSRPLSDKQRRMCYSLQRAIADWSGSSPEEVKEAFKLEFWAERVETLADKIFSLSNAPMSLVAEYQKFLVEFIISNDVPVSFPLREYADDIQAYTYACLIHKKCAVCGRRSDLHIMGDYCISLCREHKQELFDIGEDDFFDRYHLPHGVELDETAKRIYGIRRKRKNER